MSVNAKELVHKIEYYPENDMCYIEKHLVFSDADGVEITRKADRGAFRPIDIEKAKEYIGKQVGPEISFLESMWSAEAIDRFNQKMRDAEARG